MKKSEQLGMNVSTAQNRLTKDLLYKFVCISGLDNCHQCGEKISRSELSIEHIIPWLDTHDPVGLFFDLDNIAFSHISCNSRAGRLGRVFKTPEQQKARKKSSIKAYYDRTGK